MTDDRRAELSAKLKTDVLELLDIFVNEIKTGQKLDHLIRSGIIDLEASADNYVEPKLIVAALGRELTRYYAPPTSLMSPRQFKLRVTAMYQQI